MEEIDWSTVEDFLKENTPAGNCMAVIEADKIFNSILKIKGAPGKNVKERVKNIEPYFSNYIGFKKTLAIKQNLIKKTNYTLTKDEAKDSLTIYYQAVADLIETAAKISFLEKLKIRFRKTFFSFRKLIRNLLIAIFGFFGLVLFLSKTSWGEMLVKKVVWFTETIFLKLLLYLGTGLAIIIVILGTIFYFETRRKEKKEHIKIEE